MADAAAELAIRVKVIDDATKQFKGIATSMLKTVAGVAAGFLSLKAALGAMTEAEDVSAKLQRTLDGVGKKALITAGQVAKLATEIQNTSKFSDEAAKLAAEQLIRFGVVTNRSLEPTLKVTAALARQMGTDLPQAAQLVSRALLAPASASRMLRQAGIELNAEQMSQIKNFLAVGDRAKAQAVVMAELMRVTNDGKLSVDTFSEALGQLKNKAGELLEGKEGGLKGATEAIKDLSEILSDPATREAIDGFFTLLIAGATAALRLLNAIAGTVTGIISEIKATVNNDVGAKMALRLKDYEKIAARKDQGFMGGSFVPNGEGKLEFISPAEAQRRLDDQRTLVAQRNAGNSGRRGRPGKSAVGQLAGATGGDPEDAARAADEFRKGMAAISNEMEQDATALQREVAASIEQQMGAAEDMKAMFAGMHEDAAQAQEESRKYWASLSTYEEEAMRGIQQSITNFLIDPFKEGLRGLAKGILETFRDIIAQMAAAKLSKFLVGELVGGKSVGGLFSKGLNFLFGGRAGGGMASGPTVVGENGPEIVTSGLNTMRVYNERQWGKGGGRSGNQQVNYAPVYNISGVDTQQVVSYVERTRKQDQMATVEMLKRNGFGRMR